MIALFINYKSLSDERLLELVRLKADERAFDELYRRYARLLQGFFFRRTGGNNDLAADLMQDVFMRVWQTGAQANSPSKLEGVPERRGRVFENSFRTWLFTVAYNLLKNQYRTLQHEQDYLATLPTEEPAEEDNTPLQLDAETFDRALQRELQRLSEPQQLLFELRFTQELTVPEIAVILNIPEGTVKSRLHTLTSYLRQKLQNYE